MICFIYLFILRVCRVKLPSALSRSAALVPLSAYMSRRSVESRALKVDDVLVTESWLGSEESVETRATAEEAMALALAAAKAARDAASYVDAMIVENEEFPSEFDLLRLERARLSEMELSSRVEYDAEAALLEAEQVFVQKLESLLAGVNALVQEAEDIASVVKETGTLSNLIAICARMVAVISATESVSFSGLSSVLLYAAYLR